MTTEAKCNCQFCSGHISFPVEMAGKALECPHCKMETTLFIPQPAFVSKPASAPPKMPRFSTPAPLMETRLEDFGRNFLIASVVVAVVAVFLGVAILVLGDGSGTSFLSGGMLVFSAFVIVFQAFLLKLACQAAAEIIRLLRKISAK